VLPSHDRWPAESHAVRSELIASKIMELLYPDNGIYFEPELGKVACILRSQESVILDMGVSLQPNAEQLQTNMIVSSGSGVSASWVINMAERFPHCSVVGLGQFCAFHRLSQRCRPD
jgi:hypothetical protein